jgi:hypothetical protein
MTPQPTTTTQWDLLHKVIKIVIVAVADIALNIV